MSDPSGGAGRDNQASRRAVMEWLTRSLMYASATRPGGPGADPSANLRASDTERSQVADLLSEHYAAGRLDEEEFDQRLREAMSAKTRGDLSRLLVDLPMPPQPQPAEPHRSRGRDLAPEIALLAVIVLLIAALPKAAAVPPLIWVDLVAIWVLSRRVARLRRARRWHENLHEHGTPHVHGPKGPVLTQSPDEGGGPVFPSPRPPFPPPPPFTPPKP